MPKRTVCLEARPPLRVSLGTDSRVRNAAKRSDLCSTHRGPMEDALGRRSLPSAAACMVHAISIPRIFCELGGYG